ncbi:MAG: Rab family GTPase [Candidatus Hermodarchaeota archaeon]
MEHKYIIKICLLGEANVGKTSLVYRFIENKFRENYKSTLGVNLLRKDLELKKYGFVSAQIWDLGGQESFKSLRKLYLEGANGALLVYDMTDEKTFEKLDEWVQSFREARIDAPIILIGNKSDLESQIKITESKSKKYANTNNLGMVITSAKTGLNVEEAFIELTTKIINQISDD